MKNVSILVFLVLIVLVLILCSVSYQVRETESALITRFGEVSRDKVGKPGFYWKWPAPIEKVRKFDSRSQLLKRPLEETTTSGGDTILVESYLVWKIAKPQTYLESVKSKAGAVKRLRSYLREAQNAEIGNHSFSDFVNSDAEKIQLAAIEQNMLESLKAKALKGLGVDFEQDVAPFHQLVVDDVQVHNGASDSRRDLDDLGPHLPVAGPRVDQVVTVLEHHEDDRDRHDAECEQDKEEFSFHGNGVTKVQATCRLERCR